MTVVANLQQSARRWPDRVALRTASVAVEFADLWRQVRSLSDWLRRHGLRRGDRAAIVLGNTIEYVIAYYGVLAAGGVAVALNSAAKSRDFGIWLDHCGARWLFTTSASTEVDAVMPAGLRRVDVDIETPWNDASVVPECADWQEPEAEQPAAIIYTSGTTGAPKGVLLSHGNLASNTTAIVEYLSLNESDRIVNVLPFYYSYGNSVLHSHIAAGAEIVLVDNIVYPHLVVEAIARHRATGFAGVPSTFLLLLSRGRMDQYDLSSLRYVTQAGGAMPPAVAERLQQALPQAGVVIMYGQTEATARISWLPPDRLASKAGSVGIGIHGVTLTIRREDGSEALPGETGEVCVSGPNVMLGYWNDPAATAAVLKDGWLHTGDMGYLDEDGFLFLAGRRTDMIKTGAHRVYPQDIEAVIMEIPGVVECAVIGMDDDVLGEAVKALVVTSPGVEIDPQRIKAHCRANLANYKVPKVVEFRSSLPRTASGKIQRQMLSERKRTQ